MPSTPPSSLTVIMPVHNEPAWVRRSVPAVLEQLAACDLGSTELLVVDDGSTDETPGVLDALAEEHGFQVVHQENQGRLGARRTGLQQASGDHVLFIDSRVTLRPGALRFALDSVRDGALVWNAHVHVEAGNPYAAFWDGVAQLAWRQYFKEPRTTSYGLAEFDRFPKGTTCFLAPRDLLDDAFAQFSTYYASERDANDDTTIIRHIAERTPVWISPEFACDYAGRDSAQRFVRHARARGTVFVDGHLRRGGRFAPLIVAFYPASVAAVLIALRRPRLVPTGLLSLVGAVAAAGRFAGLPRRVWAPMAVLSPAFLAAFGAGMWRGVALAVRARLGGAS